jgi:putative proteasome-type protease
MIYSAGNFIEATPDTPYLQIGEHKYGKPILDRAVSNDTGLYDALKLGLISMDSTMRSNLSVGMPLDLLVYRRDAACVELNFRVDETDPVFSGPASPLVGGAPGRPPGDPAPPYNGKRRPGSG